MIVDRCVGEGTHKLHGPASFTRLKFKEIQMHRKLLPYNFNENRNLVHWLRLP